MGRGVHFAQCEGTACTPLKPTHSSSQSRARKVQSHVVQTLKCMLMAVQAQHCSHLTLNAPHTRDPHQRRPRQRHATLATLPFPSSTPLASRDGPCATLAPRGQPPRRLLPGHRTHPQAHPAGLLDTRPHGHPSTAPIHKVTQPAPMTPANRHSVSLCHICTEIVYLFVQVVVACFFPG